MTQDIDPAELVRPIIGIENRTAQEAFDIMCDRFARFIAGTAQAAEPGQQAVAWRWPSADSDHWYYSPIDRSLAANPPCIGGVPCTGREPLYASPLPAPAEAGVSVPTDELRAKLKMPTDPEWYMRKAALEEGHEVGAGKLTSTVNLTAEELAEFERLAFEALPAWAQKDLRELRSHASSLEAALPLLREAEDFVAAVVSENKPARSWAIELRAKLSAALAASPAHQGEG